MSDKVSHTYVCASASQTTSTIHHPIHTRRNETLERLRTATSSTTHCHIWIIPSHRVCMVSPCHIYIYICCFRFSTVSCLFRQNKHYALLLPSGWSTFLCCLINIYALCIPICSRSDMEKKPHHQLKQIESLFSASPAVAAAANSQRSTKSPEVTIVEQQRDVNCDVHGGRRGSSASITSLAAALRRDSLHQNGPAAAATMMNGRRESSVAPSPLIRRESSVTPARTLNGRRESSVGPSDGVLGNVAGYYGTVRLRKKESVDRDTTPSRDGVNIQRRQSFAGGNRKLSNGVPAVTVTDSAR